MPEQNLAERDGCHLSLWRKAPPSCCERRSALLAKPQPFFCQLISTSRKLSLPQFTRLSQVSTLFECDSNPNHTWTIISAYHDMWTYRFVRKWICLAKCQLTCSKKIQRQTNEITFVKSRSTTICFSKLLFHQSFLPLSNSQDNFWFFARLSWCWSCTINSFE